MTSTSRATPNLPSRDFQATADSYGRLGFVETWRDPNWMILERGPVSLEFFPHPGLDPADTWFSCCLRLDDADGFTLSAAGPALAKRRPASLACTPCSPSPGAHAPARSSTSTALSYA